MMTLTLLLGLWSTSCIQTQISGQGQGFVKESYFFKGAGEYEFTRQWFRDSVCSEPQGTDTEAGILELGKKVTGPFATPDTYEANFSSQSGIDLGAIAIKADSLRVARGVRNSSLRNTMLGLFEYKKN